MTISIIRSVDEKVGTGIKGFVNQNSPREEEVCSSTTKQVSWSGAGIGGLVFALAAKKKGFDVLVFERNLSVIRGEGKYWGPIQLQSNALAALEAIDLAVADQIIDASCITGDRINGMVDGFWRG